MGQLEISDFDLYGACDDWTVLRITKNGEITYDDAAPYLGTGTMETAEVLINQYGEKISLAICGPVGEHHGLISGISFTVEDDELPVFFFDEPLPSNISLGLEFSLF